MALNPLIAAARKFRQRIPDSLFRYLLPLGSVALLTAIAYVLLIALGIRQPVLSGTLYLGFILILLGGAWLGYGPGLLTCLIIIAVPRMFGTPTRSLGTDAVRYLLTAVICLLISRLGQTSRRRESDLRHAADQLEVRVQERSEAAVASAAATRQALEDVREQAELMDLTFDAILSLDLDRTIRFWNQGAAQMYGWTREDAIGKKSSELLLTSFPVAWDEIERDMLANGRWDGELIHVRRDGTRLRAASRWAVRRDAAGRPVGYLETATDITERRRIEEQLRHTQKLESLGVLAGGVAHDFNNLLTGILGNASLALEGLPSGHPDTVLIEEVVTAAQRAADLTRQLLAYAGKGRFVMRTIDVSTLIREISGLLQTSIPKPVSLRLQLAGGLSGVDADPGQLQQIVMNLVINAAEAIGPDGGAVVVRTGMRRVGESEVEALALAGESLAPGEYISLEVNDTGCGMDDGTISRIFDPFFTTKFAGRGLGLSAVLGIVRAHHGTLQIESKPGNGSTFRVLFPASASPVSASAPVPTGSLSGTGTVLIADDEAMVREIARQTLERYGYATLTAEDGARAVDEFRRMSGAIALVLLDLTMPVMSGEQALREMQQIKPGVRVLLTSGYNEVEAIQRFAGKGLAGFIQKPFTATGLAEKVKAVLAS